MYVCHVQINGTPVYKLGKLTLKPTLSVTLLNSQSFSRVLVDSSLMSLVVDIVKPKAEWKISHDEEGHYSHINIRIKKISLTDNATGIIGHTVHTKSNDKVELEVSERIARTMSRSRNNGCDRRRQRRIPSSFQYSDRFTVFICMCDTCAVSRDSVSRKEPLALISL